MHEKLAPLVESIVQRHLQQILDGQSVTIAGWTIEGDLLIIPNPRKGQPAFRIPLSSLSKAAYVDGYYQIWVAGVDQAIAKVSEETEGAEILHGVLNYFAGLQYTSANAQATTSQPMQTSGG